MKLKVTLRVLVAVCSVLVSQQFSEAAPPQSSKILNDLLTFHSTWISRSVTSHDPTGGNADGDGFGNLSEGPYKVLFHAKGEGRINRIWMTTDLRDDRPRKNWKDLWIIIDGSTVFRGPAVDFFKGRGAWKFPLVLDSDQASGGFLSYVPFAYHHEAKILLLGTPNYYQVTYQEGPGSAAGPTPDETSAFLSEQWWAHVPSANAKSVTLAPGGRTKVVEGSKLIEQLAVTAKDLYALEDLKVIINGQAAIPLGFFFGLGVTEVHDEEFGWAPVHSAIHFVDPQNHLLMTRLPIPLQPGDSIWIENRGTKPSDISFAYDQSSHPFSADVRLSASYIDQWAPGSDFTMSFFESAKALHFVALVEEISKGRSDNAYLEGDEMIRTDRMDYPSILGTGTEDYFNGGWYFQGPHTNATSGEPRYFDEWGSPEHSLYRNHVLDPIVSRSHFRFGFEAGDIGAYKPVHYATLGLAYEFNQQRIVSRSKVIVQGAPAESVSATKMKLKLDAESNQAEQEVFVKVNKGTSNLMFNCPREAFKNVLLVRTYYAKDNNQEAEIRLNGKVVGLFFEAYANPIRSLAQDERVIAATPADCVNDVIHFDIVNKSALGFTEIKYESAFIK